MSGKYSKNYRLYHTRTTKSGKKTGKKTKIWMYTLDVVLCLILVVLIMYARSLKRVEVPDLPTKDSPGTSVDNSEIKNSADGSAASALEDIQIQMFGEIEFDLGNGLLITDVGRYTGVYMEDGSDEIVSKILMVVVTNTSEQDLEYAEITLNGEEAEAQFSVSTLPVGASAVLLEKTRMEYPGEDVFTEAQSQVVSFFEKPLSVHADVLKLQGLDGALNITNISGKDIAGDIVIYYKNSSSDMYYGGITYRVRLEGGLKAGEIRQIMSDHYNASGSEVLFITYTS